uniref:Reverse transcriptase domain-containing protein n=1 Tax=Sparus aurata TaxID=8175 RepID=A0A671UFM6_SPAAU
MAFFSSKIDSIHAILSGCLSTLPIRTVDPQSAISQPLHCFPEDSQQEVEDIIRRMKPSTCVLDPFPTALVKTNISIISPLITTVIDNSIQAGHVPPALKTAIIRPILKKLSLDPEILANYRPISNLPFLSKVLEKAVSARLQDHLKHNNLFERFQSGFRSAHSTETALMRVTNDLLMTADAGSPSLLILLELSAAFDTVDHCILLNRLHHTIGLTDTALDWFHLYLTDRTEYVSIGGARSGTHTVTCGVPQGSVLGPTLFTLYMLPLGQIISCFGVSFRCYADDTQLYIKMDSSPSATLLPPSPLSLITTCLEEIKAWMKHNFLQLNSSKTEVILVGTPHQIQSSSITSITFYGQVIPLSTSVTNLGVIFDPHLTFEAHIKRLCKNSFHHLRNIAKLRPSLSFPDAKKLIHAFVSSRLDYCNALLTGTTDAPIDGQPIAIRR